jgi:hypothetical protein
MSTASITGSCSSAMSGGYQRDGPIPGIGVGRVLHTGSSSKRTPSISTSVVEWPSHVMRSPDGGAVAKRCASTEATCIGAFGEADGTRVVERRDAAAMSLMSGCGFSKCPSCHCG